MMVLMLSTACTGSAERDLTQPLFWTPEAEPTTEEGTVASANLQPDSPERSATATPDPPPSPTLTPSGTSTPIPTPSPTPTAAPPANTSEATATMLPTETPTPTPIPSPSPTETPIPATSTPPRPTETPRPLATAIPTDTPEPNSATIRGRILLNSVPPQGTVALTLEDQSYRVLREIEFLGGDYRFQNLPASAEGYNVVFTQASNPQFGFENVVSWAWIGPLAVEDGAAAAAPDLEIGLLGLIQTHPPADAFVSAITPQNPMEFAWTSYPDASRYWVDLHAGRTLQRVWQSDAVDSTSATFDGILKDGSTLAPGTYWWRVGAEVDGIAMTLSGPLEGFTVRP